MLFAFVIIYILNKYMRLPVYFCMRVYVANGFVEGKALQFSYRNVERSLERFFTIFRIAGVLHLHLCSGGARMFSTGRAHVQ